MSAPDNKSLKRMTLLPVLADDFVRFLKSKAPNDDSCPVCKKDHWTILCPSGDQDSFRLGTPIRNAQEIFYLSTFGYFCTNCGYLRQHSAEVVHKWVKENPSIDEAEGDGEGEIEVDSDRDDEKPANE